MTFREVYDEFVDLKYKPAKNELVALFRISPARSESVKRAAGAVAAESSVGTWTEVAGLQKSGVHRIAATCFDIAGDWIKVAYPLDNFELGSMPQIYSAIAGNILGMKAVRSIRLEDVQWPAKLRDSFVGPRFGISGVRKRLRISKRPVIACVPKPKIGFTSAQHAMVGFDVWMGGVDLLKDDENLTSQPFNRFSKRVALSMKQSRKAERNTGETKAALFNVTAPGNELLKRAKIVADAGNPYVMVDLLTCGWSGVQGLRDYCQDAGLGLYAHRAFHAAFTRNPRHGVSMRVIAKSARLVGVDHIHIGTGIGKLSGTTSEVDTLRIEMQRSRVKTDARRQSLGQDWGRIKSVMPVSSGGLHPGSTPEIMGFLGPDIVLQMGGGIHGHPEGSRAGAMAARQAVQATLDGVSLSEYAKTHAALALALDTWGFKHIK